MWLYHVTVFRSGPLADSHLPPEDSSGGSAEGAPGETGPEHSYEAQPVPQQEAKATQENHHGGPQ